MRAKARTHGKGSSLRPRGRIHYAAAVEDPRAAEPGSDKKGSGVPPPPARGGAQGLGPRRAEALAWLAAAFAFLLAGSRMPPGGPEAMAWVAGSTSAGLLCLALFGAALSHPSKAVRLGWLPSGLAPSVQAGLVLGLLAASQLVDWTIALAGLREVGTLAEFRAEVAGVSGTTFLACLLGLAVLPGFGEELALRGFLQRGLAPRFGAPAAVAMASALFAALHADWVHSAGAFVLGLYLGAVTALAGSVRPAILCHLLNNLLATTSVATGFHALAPALVVSGLFAGPWAFWRLTLHAQAARGSSQAARRPLDRTPDAPSGGDPGRPPV